MNDNPATVPLVLVLLALVAVIAGTVSGVIVDGFWKTDAVECGHAEYFLDNDHSRQWRWLPVPNERSEP